MRPGDPFEAGLFPICVATHDQGVRWLFDLATILLMLDCRPGDRVLDLGAGPGFASEMMARLGYDVVAVDPDHRSLLQNRRRPSFDPLRIDGTVRAARGIAEQLPFAAESFDGALGMNVMHHVPDLPLALTELARVLKPGSRAVVCEPGLDHLSAAETQRAIREHGEADQPFDVIAFLELARARGFSHAMLSATLQSPLRLLPFEEIELYRSGQHPRPHMTPAGVLEELQRRHAYAMLQRAGEKPKTSRHPGTLNCRLSIDGMPAVAERGSSFTIEMACENTGDTRWLAAPSTRGGYVTAGCKLTTADGRLITDIIGRTPLPGDVAAGGRVSVPMEIAIPRDLAPGRYRLQFDLVNELICWFADLTGHAPAFPLDVR